MTWSETRQKLLQLAARRGTRRAPADGSGRGGEVPLGGRVRAASLCIASGKGGTGKTVVSAGLADLFALRGRTLIVDADLGVGNAHILQDVSPRRTLVDVVEGRLAAREVLTPCSGRVDLLAGGSGVPRMADLSSYELHLIAEGIGDLESDYRFLLVDSAAGLSHQTLAFAQACDLALIVTTPDLTAMTDAYALLKVLAGHAQRRPLLLVNRARSEAQADEVFGRLLGVCERFLGMAPFPVGWIPEDELVGECVNRRGAVTHLAPGAAASQALRKSAVAILEDLACMHSVGLGERLLRQNGYRAPLARDPGDPIEYV